MGQRLSRINTAQERKRPEKKAKFEEKLNTMAEAVDELAAEKTVEKAEYEQKLDAMSEKIDFLIQERIKERTEFEQKLAAMSYTFNLLEKMEEKMAAQSAEPAAPVPTAPGPGSDGSEQLNSQQPQPKWAPVEPPKPNQPQKVAAQSGLNMNGTGQDRKDNGVDGEQKCAAALDSSRESGPREETRLSPSQGSICPDLNTSAESSVCPPETKAEKRSAYDSGPREETRLSPSQGSVCPDLSTSAVSSVCPPETKAEKKSACDSGPREETRLSPSQGNICPDLSTSAVNTVCPPETKAEKKSVFHAWIKRTPKVQQSSDKQSLDPGRHAELKECFELLLSDDGMMKIRGLDLISQLATRKPKVLNRKREEVCLAIMEQVKDQRWPVSKVAMQTLTVLLILLKKHMDPELVSVAEVLLQISASANHALRHTSILALDQMILNCGPLRCMEALLSRLSEQREQDLERREELEGDSDDDAAVRERIAAQLLKLLQFKGPKPFLVLKRKKLMQFLSTVRRLTQDASGRVRSCAEKTLAILSTKKRVRQILANLQ